jgi:site-specific DNA-methyltransferase (adenine-specific)
VLDPFDGSSTTGIAANLVGRRYLGIERKKEFAEISQKRREEIEDMRLYSQFRQKIKDIAKTEALMPSLFACEYEPIADLPF